MNTSHATFQAAMLSIVVSCAISSASAEVVLEDCTLDGSIGIANVEARCGWFERPENPADPDSTPIRLRVAVVPSLSPDPAPDAFTVINGGPGGSSLNMFADMARVFTSILRDRDIIVLDQRGTGASNPLDCPELESMDLDFAIDRVRAATRKCLESLQGDPRFYTTSVAVADLEALRAELGYPQLNVYGVSYGTRVAQHYARRHPQSVRTLIIDGVAPPEIPLGPNAALNAQRTLDRLFARCAEDVNCSQAFPSLDQHLAKLRARLETDPVPLLIAHPISGKPEEIALDYTHLVLALRMLSYAPATASLLPLIIEEAEVNENYVPLASNALRIQTELSGAIRFGMHNSVVCAEDIPFVEVDTEVTVLADHDKLTQILLNLLRNACEAADIGQPIHLLCTSDEGAGIVRIHNSGATIPESKMAHITEPFVSGKPNGSGLGLAIAVSLLEAQAGRLEIESAASTGTTVTVYLPRQTS